MKVLTNTIKLTINCLKKHTYKHTANTFSRMKAGCSIMTGKYKTIILC